MKKSMCITYRVGDGLYVNVTNRCTNLCDFCIRNNGDGAYDSDSLWLEREPTEEEIVAAILNEPKDSYSEIVFCGYGEPTCRLDTVVSVSLSVKRALGSVKIRINTNGQSDLIYGRNTAPDFKGPFDSVSISLNAPTAEGYDKICHSRFGFSAFDAMIKFASEVKKYVPDTAFSVVKEFISDDELTQCKAIAKTSGVPLKVRDYIPPTD